VHSGLYVLTSIYLWAIRGAFKAHGRMP